MKASTAQFVLRPFESRKDHEQCIDLQRATWGRDFTECVPPAILQITQKVGGVAAGAFDESGQLAGFVFGVSGLRDGRPAHWSHMLAVRHELRGAGLGTQLKALQRDLLLAAGIETARWTYDPLVSGNAHLNINRLAARPVEYVPDMYGSDTGSELHSGLGTDRFVVEWNLRDPAVERALSGEWESPNTMDVHVPVVNVGQDSCPMADPIQVVEPTIHVAIPVDIQQVKHAAPDEACTWRSATRAAFQWYLQRHYRVTGFRRGPSEDECHYILSKVE